MTNEHIKMIISFCLLIVYDDMIASQLFHDQISIDGYWDFLFSLFFVDTKL